MHPHYTSLRYQFLYRLNILVCRVIYRVSAPSPPPLPAEGPIILVCNHVSFNDPMVLLATAGRPVRFLMAREIYDKPRLRWAFKILNHIPLTRGAHDIKAVRGVLTALHQGEVVGVFPEGGIHKHREESGHLGVGYLALKTGMPLVPAAIAWAKPRPLTMMKMLLTPGKAVIRYAPPIHVTRTARPNADAMTALTGQVMDAIRDLEKEAAALLKD